MADDTTAPSTTTDSPGPTAPTAGTGPDRSDRLVIGILLVSTFVVILNETIMSVALPRLMDDLSVTAGAAQWLTSGFLLTMAVVIPITGFLLQRLSTRTVFLTAMTLFNTGTLIAAAAPGFGVLLTGRIVQATGTAIMLPLLMTTVLTLVPRHRQGRTMGNISIVISVAPALGPTISGLILNVLAWRWMFLLVLPIALASLLVGALRVRNVTEPRPVPLDVLSVGLSVVGFGGIVYALSAIGEGAGAVAPAWVPLAAGSVALTLFVLRQRDLQRSDRALLDLRAFTSRTFTVATVVLGVSMVGLVGTLVVLSIYLQHVRELDPLATGLLLLPGGLTMGLLAPLVGRIHDRAGPTVLVAPGAIIVSVVLWSLTLVTPTTPTPMVLLAHLVLSIGLALLFTPLFTTGLGALPQELYSHGSAIIGTVQHVSAAAGAALFITVMTLGAETSAAATTPAEAAASGVRAAFLCGAVISLLGVAGSLFVRRTPVPENAESSTDRSRR